jgi:branched-chain amino acid transport system permease protein
MNAAAADRRPAGTNDKGARMPQLIESLRRWTWLLIPAVLVWVLVSDNAYNQYVAGFVVIYALSALGLDWLMGRAGVVSLGNGAVMAFGALVTALVTQHGWGFLPTLVLCLVLGGVLGVLLSLPALRLHGVYFALVTLALQVVIVFIGRRYQGSDSAFVAGIPVPQATIGPWTIDFGPSWLMLLYVVLALTVVVLANLYRSQHGRSWMAIRENELAARTIGVPARRAKFVAFVGSTALISASGCLLAFYNGRVAADSFTLTFAISFVVMVIVGGLRSMSGVLLGAAIVTIAPLLLGRYVEGLPPLATGFAGWFKTNVFYINSGLFGLLVLVILLYMPRGIAPSMNSAMVRFRRSAQRRAEATQADVDARPHPVAMLQPARDVSPMLDVSDLYLTYRNGARALNGVSLTVAPGEIVGIVGRNGVGKTSLMRAITGFYRTEGVRLTGRLVVDGKDLIRASPIRSSRTGVVLVPERDKVFADLTVEEHLRQIGNADVARELLPSEWPLFEKYWKRPAGKLSGGERQLLALAVAASLKPRLLLVDEMSLGLSPLAIGRVSAAIPEIASRCDATVLLVEQNVQVAEALCDRVLLMEAGVLAEFVGDEPLDVGASPAGVEGAFHVAG